MLGSTPREHGLHPRRRFTLVHPNLSQSDLQSLLAAAYSHKQSLCPATNAEWGSGSEAADDIVQLQKGVAELSSSSEQVLDFVVQRAITLAGASGAAIAIAKAQNIVCVSRAGSTAPELGVHVDPQSSFSDECFRSGKVLCCDDSEVDLSVNVAACRQLGIRSILAVPIRIDQRVVGILEIFSGWVGAFTRQHATVLQQLAGLASDALRTSELRTNSDPRVLTTVHVVAPEEGVVTGLPAPQAVSGEIDRLTVHPAFVEAGLDTLGNYGHNHRSLLSRRVLVTTLLISIVLAAILFRSTRPKPLSVQNVPSAVTERAPLRSAPPTALLGGDGAPTTLRAIRFHSRPEFSTIALNLTSPVVYESRRLHHPERIYFDLHNTYAAAALIRSSALVVSSNPFVLRVRLAPQKGGTRLVLDLNCSCDYMSVVSSSPSYWLVIEVHQPSPAIRAAPAAGSGAAGVDKRGASEQPQSVNDDANPFTAARRIKIVIDPGHGGSDRGTVGPGGLEEKELVLEIARRLGTLVSDRLAAEITYTRSGDYFVPLEARSALANSVDADLFISIHANASDSRSVRGVETFYIDPRSSGSASLVTAGGVGSSDHKKRAANIAASRNLAAVVQHALYTRLAAVNPQLRDRGIKAAPLVVLAGPNMPSILTEISFISSASEERRLKDSKYCERIVEALYVGIATYLSRNRLRTHEVANRSSVDHINQSRLHVSEQRLRIP